MQYFFKISFIAALLMLSILQLKAQEDPDTLVERLSMRSAELSELHSLSSKYGRLENFLSYDVSIDIADSSAPGVILQHMDGQYKMVDNMFWGLEDTTEYVQGSRYSLMVDHTNKNIYLYNKPPYTRIIDLPISDSSFNAGNLKDLFLSRPGGVYKKLSIQYVPNAEITRLELVYDSTNYLLKSVAYYYNTIYYSPQYYKCMAMADTLAYPSTGVAKPAGIANADIVKAYTNFIAEFPGHVQGATVRMYVLSSQGLQSLSAPIQEAQMVASAPLPDTAKPVTQMNMMAATLANSGTWVDTTLYSTQLFEWYMGTHLNLTGYTYENYADWLINTCNYKLNQLPWRNDVFVRQDTLQNLWNQFTAKYPVSQLTISETVNVPIKKAGLIASNAATGDANDGVIYAFTWTNGGWLTTRSSNSFDLASLPGNATIISAYLSLFAYNSMNTFAPHYRSSSQYPTLQIRQVKGLYIPGKTSFSAQPDLYTGTPVATFPPLSSGQVSSGNSADYWSNQNYPNQGITSLVSFMYNNLRNTGVNYPVLYQLSDESSSYKMFQFGGISCPDQTKRPALTVMYSAARQDVFAAFVNKALGTYMSFADIQQVYNYYGKLAINSNCTSATVSQGCDAEVGKQITAIRTVNLLNANTSEFDPVIFGESRFFNQAGDSFLPLAPFQSYRVLNVAQ